jgi:hypothetical protein
VQAAFMFLSLILETWNNPTQHVRLSLVHFMLCIFISCGHFRETISLMYCFMDAISVMCYINAIPVYEYTLTCSYCLIERLLPNPYLPLTSHCNLPISSVYISCATGIRTMLNNLRVHYHYRFYWLLCAWRDEGIEYWDDWTSKAGHIIRWR